MNSKQTGDRSKTQEADYNQNKPTNEAPAGEMACDQTRTEECLFATFAKDIRETSQPLKSDTPTFLFTSGEGGNG